MTNAETGLERQLRDFLKASIASLVGLPVGEIDCDADLASYGVGSTEALVIVGDLEQFLGREIPPTVPFEHVTVNRLVAALCAETVQRGASIHESP